MPQDELINDDELNEDLFKVNKHEWKERLISSSFIVDNFLIVSDEI